ncbi:hypothetical protein G7046_g2273 [Stylonectria norvegica]|nr:hypothetical protein G7046_g2273 [Stylonectria norvegica]
MGNEAPFIWNTTAGPPPSWLDEEARNMDATDIYSGSSADAYSVRFAFSYARAPGKQGRQGGTSGWGDLLGVGRGMQGGEGEGARPWPCLEPCDAPCDAPPRGLSKHEALPAGVAPVLWNGGIVDRRPV